MIKAFLRSVPVLIALFIVGPLAGALLAGVRDADGGHAATLLNSGKSLQGLALGAFVVLIAGAFAAVAARVVSRDNALACAGLIVAWGAWRMGSVEHIIERSKSGGALTALAIEALVVGVLMLLVVAVSAWAARFVAAGGPPINRSQDLSSRLLVEPEGDLRLMPAIGAGFVASLVGAGVVGWLVATSGLKGQTLMAACFAGIAGAAASQLAASAFAGRMGVLIPAAGVVVAGVAGPLLAVAVHGNDLVKAATAGQLFPLARVLPLDWAAGAMLGVPIGLSWANSMLERPQPQAA